MRRVARLGSRFLIGGGLSTLIEIGVFNLLVYGLDWGVVAAKIEFASHLTLRELADVVDDVEAIVRSEVPEANVIYLEPDVTRTPARSIDPN